METDASRVLAEGMSERAISYTSGETFYSQGGGGFEAFIAQTMRDISEDAPWAERELIGVGLLRGIMLAFASPEWAQAELQRIHTAQKPIPVRLAELRVWMAAHPVAVAAVERLDSGEAGE